jgi:hypothetical protein
MTPSDDEKCAKLAYDDLPAGCRLSTLRKRSQIDFEIEFFECILSRDPNYVEGIIQSKGYMAGRAVHHRIVSDAHNGP